MVRHGFLALLLAVTGVAVRSAAAEAEPNRLRNGDCEERTGSTLSVWHLAQPATGTMVMSACLDKPREGLVCMSLRGIADWACGEGEHLPFAKGTSYTLTGFARATRGDVFLQISYWRENEWLGLTRSEAVTTDGDWQACSAVTERDRFPAATHISISGTARGGDVEAWFDALALTPTPPAPR